MAGKISRRALARAVAGQLLATGADSRKVMSSLAAYLVEHSMTDHADVIMNDIADELMLQAGLLTVEVTSARPLTADARQRLTVFLQTETGAKSVALHESTDESLVGGLVARTAAGEIDASIRTKLRQLTAVA